MDALEQLRCILTISHGSISNSTVINAPAGTDEVVRAWFAMTLAAGHHPDAVLNEMERILEDYRGMEFTVIEDDDDE